MEFWRLVEKTTRQKSLLVKLMRDVESGYFVAPKGFDILTRYRPEDLSLTASQGMKVDLAEKPLTREFLKKYPEAKSEPVALDSFSPSVARQFAQRQLLLMQTGSDAAAAFAQAETDLSEQLLSLKRRQLRTIGGGSPVELLLQQEQEQLDAGLGALAQQRLEGAGATSSPEGGAR